MKLFEFFGQLEVTEAPKRFPDGHYTHTPGALEVMPTQDKTLWADAGELPKKFNVTKMKIAIYDEQDDEDPYSYGNGGLLVYHNAGTWKMYTDDVTRVQIADYLGIANKDIDFSEQGMQDEEYMHFDIEDDAVAQLIDKGAFKLEESTTEDDMSTGVVQVGKKGKTRRATGIDDNPYDHNEGEDQTALANAALWNMKDIYQTIMAGEALSEDDMFSYGDLVQYLEQADMPDHYSKFWDLVTDAINSAGGFGGQGSELQVDKNIAPQIKTLYQQFKAATAKIKGVKEAYQLDNADKQVLAKLEKEYEGYKSMWTNAKDLDDKKMYQERLRDLFSMIRQVKGEMKYGIDTALQDELSDMYDELPVSKKSPKEIDNGWNFRISDVKDTPMPSLMRNYYQPHITQALRKAAGFPESAYVYFDDADLVYGSKTVWPMCGVDDKCTFGDAVKALKKFAKSNPSEGESHFKEELGADKEAQIKAWANKYKKYEADNGDPLPAGFLENHLNTGVPTDSIEAGEVKKYADKYGDDALGDLSMEQVHDNPDEFPITNAFLKDLEKIFGYIPHGDEVEEIADVLRYYDGPKGIKEDDVDAVYPGTGEIYGYTWNCKKCGTENEFSMSRKDAQEYIDEWEADNEDLVADGETGSAALTDTLSQGEDSGFHYGNKCVKCGAEAKDPYQESINDILRLSGLK